MSKAPSTFATSKLMHDFRQSCVYARCLCFRSRKYTGIRAYLWISLEKRECISLASADSGHPPATRVFIGSNGGKCEGV